LKNIEKWYDQAMPRRPKDPVLARLKTPADWDAFLLKTYGLPLESRSDLEKGESRFRDPDRGTAIPLEKIAGLHGVYSEPEVLQKDSHERETGSDERIVLSPDWARYFDVMDIVVDAVVPEARRDGAKEALLAECRIGTVQGNAAPDIAADLGTPEQLRRRWHRGEIEFRPVRPANRQEQAHVIEIREHYVPPDEPEEPGAEPDQSLGRLKWRRH
jgi:hypothetical protein